MLDYVFGFCRSLTAPSTCSATPALSIYLAIALLSLKLWELTDLAGPLMIILAAQTVVMALCAVFVTFPRHGQELRRGRSGRRPLRLWHTDATPTAVANMQAITNQYGPSHKAFLIVPLVGAFFIDIINAFLLQGMLSLLRADSLGLRPTKKSVFSSAERAFYSCQRLMDKR